MRGCTAPASAATRRSCIAWLAWLAPHYADDRASAAASFEQGVAAAEAQRAYLFALRNAVALARVRLADGAREEGRQLVHRAAALVADAPASDLDEMRRLDGQIRLAPGIGHNAQAEGTGMRECVRRMAVAVLMAVVVGLGSAGQASAQAACDRACLRAMLDQYLEAVIKHDPKAAPLVVGFRQTENALNVAPGNGVWKTMTGLGKMQRRYLDATAARPATTGWSRKAAARRWSRCGCGCRTASSPRPSGTSRARTIRG